MVHALPVTLIVEIVLSVLLLATVGYCAVLERKLSALRAGQDGLKDTISQLNAAISAAGTSMRLLKVQASGAIEELDGKVGAARAAIDELSLLTVSGERIAARFERGAEVPPRSDQGVLPAAANRLDAARTRIVRQPQRLAEALGSVR